LQQEGKGFIPQDSQGNVWYVAIILTLLKEVSKGH
jgi:hypothetical protein